MAKTAAKKKQAPASAVALPEPGDEVIFKGYSEEMDKDEQVFKKGETLIIETAELDDDGESVKIVAYKKKGGGKDPVRQAIFMPDEAELADADESEEDETEEESDAEEDADDEPAPKSKGKSKAAAKAPVSKKAVAKKAVKEKEEKAAPARTKDEAEQELVHAPSVAKLIKKGHMLESAKELIQSSSEAYFKLGGVLTEIHRTKAYLELDYEDSKDGFEEYIKTELEIEYKKATMLMATYKTFTRLGIDAERFGQVGWTKAYQIASLMRDASAEEIEAMLEAAMDMTRDDLIEHIKETSVSAAGRSRGDNVKKVKYSFTAFADEADYIGQCLEKVMSENGFEEQNEAFIHIIREWASMVDGVDIELKDAVKVVEKRYGVKLDVVTADKEDTMPRTSTKEKAPVKAKAKPAPAKAAKKAPAKKAKAVVKGKTAKKKAA